MALSEVLLAVMTQCPCLTPRHKVDVKVQAVLKGEQTFKSPPDHPLIVPHLRRHFILSCLSAGSFVCVGLNERGRRHFCARYLLSARWQPIRQLRSSGSFANRGSVSGVTPCHPFGLFGGETLKFGFLVASRCSDSLPEWRKF